MSLGPRLPATSAHAFGRRPERVHRRMGVESARRRSVFLGVGQGRHGMLTVAIQMKRDLPQAAAKDLPTVQRSGSGTRPDVLLLPPATILEQALQSGAAWFVCQAGGLVMA